MSNIPNRERIEDYLFRRMSEEEERGFVEEMEGNEELKAEVEEVSELLGILKEGERVRQYERFVGLIEEDEANEEDEASEEDGGSDEDEDNEEDGGSDEDEDNEEDGAGEKKTRRSRFRLISFIGVAAAVVALLVMFFGNRSYIDRYFSPRPEETTMAPSAPQLLKQGMNAYQNQEYQESISLFEAVKDTASGYNTACIYLANAHLQLDNSSAALARLLILERIGDTKYEDDRRWLLGLIYLDQGEEGKGKAVLRELYDDPSTNYKKDELKGILESIE